MAEPCMLCELPASETSGRMVVPVKWRQPAGKWKDALTAHVCPTSVVACAEDRWPPIDARVQFVLRFSALQGSRLRSDIRCSGKVAALSNCSRSAAVSAATLTIERYRITAGPASHEDRAGSR